MPRNRRGLLRLCFNKVKPLDPLIHRYFEVHGERDLRGNSGPDFGTQTAAPTPSPHPSGKCRPAGAATERPNQVIPRRLSPICC